MYLSSPDEADEDFIDVFVIIIKMSDFGAFLNKFLCVWKYF